MKWISLRLNLRVADQIRRVTRLRGISQRIWDGIILHPHVNLGASTFQQSVVIGLDSKPVNLKVAELVWEQTTKDVELRK